MSSPSTADAGHATIALTYRPVREADLPQLVRFLRDQQRRKGGPDAALTWDEAFFRWLLFGGRPRLDLSFGAFAGDRLVGFAGNWPRRLWVGGRERLVTECGIIYVDAAHRDERRTYHGLLQAMRDAKRAAGVALTLGPGNLAVVKGGVQKGLVRMAPMRLWRRPLDARLLTDRLARSAATRRALGAVPDALLAASLAPARLVRRRLGVRIETIHGFDERMDALWREFRRRHPIAFVRDRAAMGWRYADAPKGYWIRAAYRGDRLAAVAVTGHVPGDTEAAYLVDYVSGELDRGALAYAVVGDVLAELRSRGFSRVRSYLFPGRDPDPLRPALRAHGFLPTEERNLHWLGEELADPEAFASVARERRWTLRAGDAECF